MKQFLAVPKKWGNSIGITIPSEIIKKEHIQSQKKITVLVIGDQQKHLENVFGTLKLKRKTQDVMKDVDEGYGE